MQLCYKKFLNLCHTSKKCEYVMLEGNVRNMMLHTNPATLRELTHFILGLI